MKEVELNWGTCLLSKELYVDMVIRFIAYLAKMLSIYILMIPPLQHSICREQEECQNWEPVWLINDVP